MEIGQDNQVKLVDYGYAVSRDVKLSSIVEALKDVWTVMQPECLLLIRCEDHYPANKGDVYYQGLWREIKSFPNIKFLHRFTYRENKKDYWLMILKKEEEPVVISEGQSLEIVSPKFD